MTIQLPNLPFDVASLSPFISAETLAFHHGKHHATYVKNTNDLIVNTPLADKSLKDIILISAADTVLTPVFNNAAQCFNHEFYWKSLSPLKQDIPEILAKMIIRDFGSVADFKHALHQAATSKFGSGWCWLTLNKEGELQILTTGNADTPLTKPDLKPLLCIDVWEHAYYLDYQNRRTDYLWAVIDNLLNWQFATENLTD
ncbi:MAG: superoxide dismutase [Alphaproteobacteria bacterium]|nr:superoxide dismutase [Alphaproteobacteria bacterium]